MTSLHKLKGNAQYVFHGSPRKLTQLKPQQQMTFSYLQGGLVRDGKPAICATPFLKVAVFRSLVHKDFTGFGVTNKKVVLRASSKALHVARRSRGYVYVFLKKDFRKHNSMEWRSYHTLRPKIVIQTSSKDIPHGIRIIKDWQRWRKQFARKHKTAL